jgi:hypothetical protein
MTICTCPEPDRSPRPPNREHECVRCGLFACSYAGKHSARCSPAICDCFIDTHPDSPMDLHPEDFLVLMPDGTYFRPDPIKKESE